MNTERKFPIGPVPEWDESFDKTAAILRITSFPTELEQLLRGIVPEDYSLTYRTDSWTIQQVVHHLADSHINAYLRLKWGLTENHPDIKEYNEVAWAELPDGKSSPLEVSVSILKGIHYRMGLTLSELEKKDWNRSYFHTDRKKSFTINQWLVEYDWHGRHHLGHIRWALENRSK